MYMSNGLTVKKFLKAQKMTTIQPLNIVVMNMLKRKMKEQMTNKVKMEIEMVRIMMMMWMIRNDENHALSITLTWYQCHIICCFETP